MWLLLSGVLVSCVVVVAFGAQAGSLTLAVFLAVVGVGRATIPPPGGRGLVVRSRAFDLFAYWSMAAAIAVLALVAPGM